MQLTHKMELHLLVPYNRETLMGFLDGLGTFAPQGGVGERLGQLLLDEEVPVVALEVEQAAKKRRKDWEGAARYLLERGLSAGLFVFHDAYGAYRLSLVSARYRGKRKPELSDYRRHSLIAHPDQPNKTFFQQLHRMAENPPASLDELQAIFSVEAVSEAFYREFLGVFSNRLVEGVVGADSERQDFALAFVQRRGWLGGREDFLPYLYKRYAETVGVGDRFYREWLEPLFFQALKAPPGSKRLSDNLPPEVREALEQAPYLNGEAIPRLCTWYA